MNLPTNPIEGKIITFYSYKGGTGRTMALANIACLLAIEQPDKKVLVMDWDLEAPGLHRYFLNYTNPQNTQKFDDQKGVLELFETYQASIEDLGVDKPTASEVILSKVELNRYIIPLEVTAKSLKKSLNPTTIYFLKAGNYNTSYTRRLSEFNWNDFFYSAPTFFKEFAEYVCTQYDYILVDSRTGNTDVGGICTHILPEKLVTVFTPNRQSLTGILALAKKAISYRKDSDDFRPLEIIPLPSRIDLENSVQRVNWKNGNEEENIIGYQIQFEELFRDIYSIKSSKISLEEYFNNVQIRHDSTYAYGEHIAVLEEDHQDTAAFAHNYWLFYQELFKEDNIYDLPNLKNVLVYYEKGAGKATSSVINQLYDLKNEEVVVFYASKQTEKSELAKLVEQADMVVNLSNEEIPENNNIMRESSVKYLSENDLIIAHAMKNKPSFKIALSMSGKQLIDFSIEGESEEFAHYKTAIEQTLNSLKDDALRTEQLQILDKIAASSKNEQALIRNYLNELRAIDSKEAYPNPLDYVDSAFFKFLSEKGKDLISEGRGLILNYNDLFLSFSTKNGKILNRDFSQLIEFFYYEEEVDIPNNGVIFANLIEQLFKEEGLTTAKSLPDNREKYARNVSINSSISFVQMIIDYTFHSDFAFMEYESYQKSVEKSEFHTPMFIPILTDSLDNLIPIRNSSDRKRWISNIKNTYSLDLSNFSNAAIFDSNQKEVGMISSAAKSLKKEIKTIARKIVNHREQIIDQFIENLE